ncbi:uncharacterized protein FOMMEDRAFT_16368 [Fomitiporia mediterranea MF3/22]|uniref:uncharacterized protein n=1 Tax=Fomitiporia mediterranea (strain MF3/22) TaxID=694068 RepID=UPI000440813D|nr:uncharacterized protein FOMMEDRAFT_16368 [Fomitiporia mediterranea MF3/22]EJD07770.1 hypothetical protein FOMMEDRAFT_16368 [Fomitiporia mediterranea MF3/22]
MRVSGHILVCALVALATHLTLAKSVDSRRDGLSVNEEPTTSQLREDVKPDALDESSREDGRVDSTGLAGVYTLRSDQLEIDALVQDTVELRSAENDERDSSDGDSNESDEQDFASPPSPINEGRRRAGILGILAVIALTSALGYSAYTRRERLREILSTITQHLPEMRLNTFNFKRISLPTLTLPTLSAPQRARRRRLRRAKGGFRPHVSRLRAWADAERGLLNDYDYEYDGDYERDRGQGLSWSSSGSSEDSHTQETEAIDLGADEDFMIGAPRRSSSASASTSASLNGSRTTAPGKGMGRVWGRWKSVSGKGSSKKARRGDSVSGSGTVLFSVADDADDLQLETDEAMPLAPSPHRYPSGWGSVKGYGSAG